MNDEYGDAAGSSFITQHSSLSIPRDRVVVFEVMAEELDRAWWREYREELERRFRQEKMVARATEFEKL